jgi:hydroxypyruvate reductase
LSRRTGSAGSSSLRGSSALRRKAAAILEAGLRAADPRILVRGNLKAKGRSLVVAGHVEPWPRRLFLLAVGKAALPMAREAQRILSRRLDGGLVVTTEASGPSLPGLRVLESGHPLPDRRGLLASLEVERLCRGRGRDDLLLLLLSGGASALLPAPVDGISLKEKARTTALLLAAGADIHELNTVRKHLSRLKGGGLARLASPARVRALVLSDVVGDDLTTIASGPVSPDPTTYADALTALDHRGVLDRVPASVRAHLRAGERGHRPETPKTGDPAFQRVRAKVVGSNLRCLEAMVREARRRRFRPHLLTSRLTGEAREVAGVLAGILRECVETGRPVAPPCCLLAGGETTVTVRGQGFGGRNQEMAVAAAPVLAGFPRDALFASLATDGIDGRSDAAGGVVDRHSAGRARELGLAPPADFLARSDSRSFLGPLGGLIVTGPTGTNVMDLTVLLAV